MSTHRIVLGRVTLYRLAQRLAELGIAGDLVPDQVYRIQERPRLAPDASGGVPASIIEVDSTVSVRMNASRVAVRCERPAWVVAESPDGVPVDQSMIGGDRCAVCDQEDG
jgi:hypothetical protein